MTTTATTPTTDGTGTARASARRQVPFALAVAGSLLLGLVTAAVLVLVLAAGASEPVITGSGLVGFGVGWALLPVVSTRWTRSPQRWAAVPAAVMGATGAALLVFRPDDGELTVAGWLWPPAALALAVWMGRAARRATTSRGRWLVYPAIAVVALTAMAGGVETITLAGDQGRFAMPGTTYDVGGHRLHLTCTGTGGPTVVLENGLGEPAALWDGLMDQVSRTTRVCAYDRPGQMWSDDLDHPQDGLEVAADLHRLLARAGEHGPYVLAGHSSGGTLAMTYAARYPAQVTGMVLLDSSSPHQYTAIPSFAGTYAAMRRLLPVMPALARLGASHLIPPSSSTALSPAAAAQVRSFSTSPRGARNLRDEHSQLRAVFTQAQALTTIDPKPLAVVTARENADGEPGWAAAQNQMSTLSTNSSHWVADTTHVGLLDDATGAAHSIRAITDVVTAVRTGAPLASR